MKYEIFDPRVVANQGICYPVIKSTEETLQEILDKKCSIARFGDGEFAIMANRERQKFQNLNLELGKRLREVIRTQDERLLIGIADNYGNLEKFTQDAADKIRVYMTDEIRREQMQFLDLKRVYGNAYVTRPYVLMADNRTDAPAIYGGKIDYYDTMPTVFQHSKINLNITLKTIQTGIPLRAWDILGCGGFLLTNFQQELCDFFIPGEDFVYYESPADAIEKAAYFLSHDRDRQEIAHNAFEKIAASHTFHHRVQSMFDII